MGFCGGDRSRFVSLLIRMGLLICIEAFMVVLDGIPKIIEITCVLFTAESSFLSIHSATSVDRVWWGLGKISAFLSGGRYLKREGILLHSTKLFA